MKPLPQAALASGPALAEQLRELTHDLESGLLSPTMCAILKNAIVEVTRLIRRQAALLALWDTLGAPRSKPWLVAKTLEAELRRFDGVRRSRVQAGRRTATPLEVHLLILLETGGPTCARKLWDELRELRELPAHGQKEP